jgi:hypothetical protein
MESEESKTVYKDKTGRIIQAGDILVSTYHNNSCPLQHKITADDDGDLFWDTGDPLSIIDQTQRYFMIVNR